MTMDDRPVSINKVVRTRSRKKGVRGTRRSRDLGPKKHPGASTAKAATSGPMTFIHRSCAILRQHRKLAALGAVLLVLLVSYTAVQLYARSMVGQAGVTVEGLRLTGFDGRYLLFTADTLIENPSSLSARLDEAKLEVHYQGTRVGDIWVPGLELEPGANHMEVDFRFLASDQGAYQRVTADLLLGGKAMVVLKGTLSLHSTIGLDVPLDKTVQVRDLSL